MTNYDFVAGDTASVYGPRTLTDSGGSTVLDLTGSTVNLLIYQNAGDYQISNGAPPPTFSRQMAIVDPLLGTVQYQFATGDLVSGVMYLIIQVVNSLGDILTETDPQAFLVR